MSAGILSTREITPKEARPQKEGFTFLSKLPGELRNEIYSLVLNTSNQLVPQPRLGHNHVSPRQDIVPLLLSSSMVFYEVRGLLENFTVAYIPVKEGLPYNTAELQDQRADTITGALEQFVNVHFHLHVTQNYRDRFRARPVLNNLRHTLHAYMSHSQTVSRKHKWRRRRAVIHLDNLISTWTIWEGHPIGAYRDLIDLIAWDVNTDWEIRFYVPTMGMASLSTSHDLLYVDVDFAHLKALCRTFQHINVVAEVYGKNVWCREEEKEFVTRNLLPRCKVWPNVRTNLPHSAGKRLDGH
jgi:hypothetical protein